jgi:hypothetical protein
MARKLMVSLQPKAKNSLLTQLRGRRAAKARLRTGMAGKEVLHVQPAGDVDPAQHDRVN